MKKLIYITSLSVLALAAVSCDDFLKCEDNSFQSKEYQFSTLNRTKQVATNVYSYVLNYMDDVNGTMREAATDNAIYAWESNNIKTYYDGSWSATRTIDDQWAHFYEGIRAANYYLENAPEDFPGTEYTDNYEARMREYKLYKYEVRALRAYYHFELAKRYQNIVIVERSYNPEEVNNLVPVSFATTMKWIIDELDAVTPELPVDYTQTLSTENGRVTKGFCQALKIRCQLYLASPLNNPNNDVNLWINTAVTARDFMANPEYTYKIKSEAVVNNENAVGLIFGVRRNESNAFEAQNYPIGINGVSGGICPTENLAEAFDLKNGTTFDWDQHKADALNLDNRDPRMKRTLRGNGHEFNAEAPILETYYGGKNGQPIQGATPSSFYLYKFIQPETVIVGNPVSYPHVAPIFRFAEVYLNYAEALFEATGNPKAKVAGSEGFQKTPLAALNEVRKRFFMTTLPDNITPEEFKKKLREERRIEFAFEDQRFWDIRRWKIGDQTTDIYGLDIKVTKDDQGEITSTTIERKLIQKRVWNDKYYWYPIPDSERFKNTNLNQNPGW